MDTNVEVLIVDSKACNDESMTEMDLSSFTNLRVFEVGNECFENVNYLRLIGLNQLERVVIGEQCFRGSGIYIGRHFYLKNCERVRELKIGRYSFYDYVWCEIENVPSLEVIEIGGLNEDSCNFRDASLELKSYSQRMK